MLVGIGKFPKNIKSPMNNWTQKNRYTRHIHTNENGRRYKIESSNQNVKPFRKLV